MIVTAAASVPVAAAMTATVASTATAAMPATVTATVTAEQPAKAATVAAAPAHQKEYHNTADQQNQQPVVRKPLHFVFLLGMALSSVNAPHR